MKLSLLRRPVPPVRTPYDGGIGGGVVAAVALPVTALVLVAATLLAGATFATAMAVLPTSLPIMIVGWAGSIGFAFALPLAVVRGVVAALERLE